MIEDLHLETHHRGAYVILRTVTPVLEAHGINAIVEDESMEVTSLQVFKHDKDRDINEVLARDTVLVVKEPYFKFGVDGSDAIRVDHLSDIMYLPKNDERAPDCWKVGVIEETDASGWKMKGNDYFKGCKYERAIECYAKALRCAPMEDETRSLYLNRSLAFLKVNQPDAAFSDVQSLLKISDPTEKVLFRKGQALYSLERYKESCEVFKAICKEYPSNVAAKGRLTQSIDRLAEQQHGRYQFKKMLKEAKELSPPHLDHASYIGPVAIRQTKSRGRGLFTTKEVKAGDLLLCEKAFGYAFAKETNWPDETLHVVPENHSKAEGARADLLGIITRKLHNSPSSSVSTFTNLYHGSYKPIDAAVTATEVDDRPVADTFLVRSIIQSNCFTSSLSTHDDIMRASNLMDEQDSREHSGIWLTASHINHSCYSNAQLAFIGDMLIFRAAQDLGANTEILFSYQTPNVDYNGERQGKLRQTWRIDCDCAICQDYKTTAESTLLQRERLHNEALKLVTRHLKLVDTAEIESLIAQLADTVYTLKKQRAKSIESFRRTLEALGYVIEGGISASKPLLIKKWGLIKDDLIHLWILLSALYFPKDPQTTEYSRTTYKICNGEDETYDEMCRAYEKFA